GRGNSWHAVLGEQLAHPPDPADVRVAVFLGIAKTFGQMRPHDVAVQNFNVDNTPRLQRLVRPPGQGALTSSGKPGKPDRETPLPPLVIRFLHCSRTLLNSCRGFPPSQSLNDRTATR